MGLQIDQLISQSQAVYDACVAGEYMKAWEDTIPIQQTAIDLGRKVGLRASYQGCDTAKHTKLEECWTKIAKVCDEKCAALPATEEGAEVGKIGDGKILAALLALLKILGPLIPLFFKPQS